MELLNDLQKHLKNMNVQWYLCGGYAIDGFLGYQTRGHKDIDITVSFDDMSSCIKFLKTQGWTIDVAIGGGKLVNIDQIEDNKNSTFNNIWCYRKTADFIHIENIEGIFKYAKYLDRIQTELDFIEVLFNKIEDGYFYYKRNHAIKRVMEKSFIRRNDMNILAPEIVLLYKSNSFNNPNYQQDFDLTMERIDNEAYEWLMDALYKEYPQGHPWIDKRHYSNISSKQ